MDADADERYNDPMTPGSTLSYASSSLASSSQHHTQAGLAAHFSWKSPNWIRGGGKGPEVRQDNNVNGDITQPFSWTVNLTKTNKQLVNISYPLVSPGYAGVFRSASGGGAVDICGVMLYAGADKVSRAEPQPYLSTYVQSRYRWIRGYSCCTKNILHKPEKRGLTIYIWAAAHRVDRVGPLDRTVLSVGRAQ